MVLFQVLAASALMGLGAGFLFRAYKSRYILEMRDSRGVVRKRDIRNGRFVK